MEQKSKSKEKTKSPGLSSDRQFGNLAIERVKNLLANPELSASQKRVLLNILHKLEKEV
jgi:hypothetical protein